MTPSHQNTQSDHDDSRSQATFNSHKRFITHFRNGKPGVVGSGSCPRPLCCLRESNDERETPGRRSETPLVSFTFTQGRLQKLQEKRRPRLPEIILVLVQTPCREAGKVLQMFSSSNLLHMFTRLVTIAMATCRSTTTSFSSEANRAGSLTRQSVEHFEV